jgi:hypothetical protein
VRILRHEYEEEAEHFDHEQLRIIDVVHKDFLGTYLDQHVIPFSQRFAERALRHPTELATGLAFVSGMGSRGWDPIESKMKPRSPASRLSRTVAMGRNILRFIASGGKRL